MEESAGDPGLEKATKEANDATPQAPKRRLPPDWAKGALIVLVGVLLAWASLQLFYPVFHIPEELRDLGGPGVTPEQDQAQLEAIVEVRRQNSVLALAFVGAVLGATLGLALAGGWRSLMAGAAGALTGGLFGAAGGLLGDATYAALATGPPLSLRQTLMVHVTALVPLGIGIGLAIGATIGSARAIGARVISSLFGGVSGMFGGAIAAVVYAMGVSLILPRAQTQFVIPPGTVEQLLWIAAAAACIGLIAHKLNESITTHAHEPA